MDGVEELPVAGLDGDVDHAAIEVQLADGMAGDGGRLAHGRVVLPVRGAEPAGAQDPVAARIHHPPGQVQVASVARRPVQLDEGHLDLGMPVDGQRPGRTEGSLDVVRGADRDLEQSIVAQRAVPGDGRLDQMADAVELVTPGHVAVRMAAADDLDEGVDVAVVALGPGDGRDRLVRRGREVGVASPAELPADGLEPLVDVRVQERERLVEHHADGPVRTRRAGREPEVVQGAGLRQLLEPVRDRALAVASAGAPPRTRR